MRDFGPRRKRSCRGARTRSSTSPGSQASFSLGPRFASYTMSYRRCVRDALERTGKRVPAKQWRRRRCVARDADGPAFPAILYRLGTRRSRQRQALLQAYFRALSSTHTQSRCGAASWQLLTVRSPAREHHMRPVAPIGWRAGGLVMNQCAYSAHASRPRRPSASLTAHCTPGGWPPAPAAHAPATRAPRAQAPPFDSARPLPRACAGQGGKGGLPLKNHSRGGASAWGGRASQTPQGAFPRPRLFPCGCSSCHVRRLRLWICTFPQHALGEERRRRDGGRSPAWTKQPCGLGFGGGAFGNEGALPCVQARIGAMSSDRVFTAPAGLE
jgi:hypothetical protein